MRTRLSFLPGLALGALAALPQPALACAVCFGDPEAPMTRGIVFGIWVLLLVVLGVLGGIVTFFVHSARRSSEIAKRQSSEPKP